MADNTQIETPVIPGDVIATDDLTTLNGSVISGVKAQRVKAGFGVDADLRDVDATDKAHGLPTQLLDGADVTQGAIADAAVAAGATGTIGAKLRAISRDLVANVVLAAGAHLIGKVTLRNSADSADIDPLAEATFTTGTGGVTETAPATDTASSGLNGRLQRIAQRLTSLIALLPASVGQKLVATSFPVVLPSDGTLPLPTGAATESTLGTTNTEIGGVTETAPATDTASSGLNGRLQRVAQRLTSILAKLPALGTAGTPSADVLSVQGATSGTALNVSIADAAIQPTNAFTTAYGNSKQVKATAGWLLGFTVHNKSAAKLYVALYNAASKTGTPLQYYPVYANDTTSVVFGDIGKYCSVGVFLQGMTVDDGTDTSDASSSLWFDSRVI